MKFLYITTLGCTMGFFKSLIRELLDEGHIIDIACNQSGSKVPQCYVDWGCKIYDLTCTRSPLSKGNIIAINQIKNIVIKEEYDIVHCHTPIAAACTRFACKGLRKKGVKIIYTAHGFHFYKGAPLKNWLMYYPIERICSHFTDILITINKEDYELAQRKLKAKRIEYVPGVGVDLDKFKKLGIDRQKYREEIGVPSDCKLLLSAGELNINKNHETVIKALGLLKKSDIYYCIAGRGSLSNHLIDVAKECGVSDKVKLLGFRSDINELYEASDIYILPSFREGLNVSLMEAMSKGLPIICGNIRGNIDLIDENGGKLFIPNSIKSCCMAIQAVSIENFKEMGNYNKNKIRSFSSDIIFDAIKSIYGIVNKNISK